MNYTYLEAVSGDCSAGGLSDVGDKIYVEPKYKEIVQVFMIAQADWLTEVCFADLSNPTPGISEALENFYDAAQN